MGGYVIDTIAGYMTGDNIHVRARVQIYVVGADTVSEDDAGFFESFNGGPIHFNASKNNAVGILSLFECIVGRAVFAINQRTACVFDDLPLVLGGFVPVLN